MKILNKIDKSNDLKNLSFVEKKQLAKEIRELIITTVSKTGGHLASNLGVVELTIALHSVFDVNKDKIIWDVGHQSYVHKILTGRKEKLSTLRKLDGIAGFPKTAENECDAFNTGHSSTSISVGIGMARARELLKEDKKIIAVIGDGSLTGGMALEALNDAGSSDTDLMVILNDNEMSISKNVGGVPLMLSKLRTKKLYTTSNNTIKTVINKIPLLGPKIVNSVRKIKYGIKQLVIPNMYFEDIGFSYLGPVDGHDIEKLESLINKGNNLKGPVLIHVITKKGYGYLPAEQKPDKFHSTSSFDIKTGEKVKKASKDYSKVFGDKLVELAQKNERIVAVTAAMKDGTGLTEFAKKFPNRFFDVGIAEQHAVAMVAGMAKAGLKPVIPLYSSFAQRAYDQIIHDICIQNLPVIIGIDRAGCVGNDGETHQGLFDLSFLQIIPNITIMAPKDFKELEMMLEFAVNYNGPIAIRYPRGEELNIFEQHEELELGRPEIIKTGKDLTIIAIGKMVSTAIQVAEDLENVGINCNVINTRFLKPLNKDIIKNVINDNTTIVTIEDNILKGGLGCTVLELINEFKLNNINLISFGYPDKFIQHGNIDEIEEIYGLDKKSIVKEILKKVN